MGKQVAYYEQPDIIRRRSLTNSDFSIICSNCVGGLIYHQLGLKFLSPTINLSIKSQDFLDFVLHLHEYIDKGTLVEDQTANCGYPVGILKRNTHQVRLYFVHYSDFSTAKHKWEARKQRINYNKLYIIMTDNDGATLADMQAFDRLAYKHKVILTGRDYPSIKSAFWIKNCEQDGHLGAWYQANNYLGKLAFQQFDYVRFLNQQ